MNVLKVKRLSTGPLVPEVPITDQDNLDGVYSVLADAN
jgi:hypothetical protein